MSKRKKKRSRISSILFTLIFLTGFGVLSYPFIANKWNTYRQGLLITSYTSNLEQQAETIDYSSEWEKAEAYNEALLPMILPDSFALAEQSERDEVYMSCLNLNGDDIMGIVEIPKINIKIPIYHTTDTEVLEIGAGHLEGSSLPIGSKTGHTVISAHRGLPSAALFTDLDKLKLGDHFLLHILDETLCYEVDQIDVVEPEDTELLGVEENRDLATLLTCTPYGVNSHRLLVRGIRVPYEPEVVEEEEKEIVFSVHTNYLMWVFVGMGITGIFILILYLRERALRKRLMQKRLREKRDSKKI